MLQDRLNSFSFLLLVSLLLHGVLAAAVLWQQRRHAEKPATPAALRVFAVAATALRPAPVTPPVAAVVTPAVVTPAATSQAKDTAPAPVRQAAPQVRTNATPRTPRSTQHKTTPSAQPPQPPQPASTSPQSQATTTAAPDLEQILSSARQNAASAHLSDAELQALTITPSRRTAGPVATVRRPQVKPGSGPAGDVLETLADGRQLVRVGNGCVLADAGADLRKNIHSMKIVACGAGGRSEQDRIDAHFEQVMSAIGSHR